MLGKTGVNFLLSLVGTFFGPFLLLLKSPEEFVVSICDQVQAAWLATLLDELLDVNKLLHVAA
jgi:hypothetical protein